MFLDDTDGRLVELADTPDLGSGAERCRGSSPRAATLFFSRGVLTPRGEDSMNTPSVFPVSIITWQSLKSRTINGDLFTIVSRC